MGGNARYIDRSTGKDMGFAEKIDLTKIDRTTVVSEIISCLSNLNKEYFIMFGAPLWNDFRVIANGSALNGSSNALFNNSISDTEFVSAKTFVGDIDVTFPEESMGNLWHLLNSLEHTQMSKTLTYLGHKNSTINATKVGNLNQINAVFKLETPTYTTNIQIDLEASEYFQNLPTAWTSFSHNSDWEDIKAGYKGVMHKYALINLSRAASKLENISVVTKSQISKLSNVSSSEYKQSVEKQAKKELAKASTNAAYKNPTDLAFSIDRGMRHKFVQIFHTDGIAAQLDGKNVFYEAETDNSVYETNLEKMFELIFKVPPQKDDMKLFRSFVGVTSLIKKYLNEELITEFFNNHLIKKSLFAPFAQGLERNNPEADLKIKTKMVDKLYITFPYLIKYKEEVDSFTDSYYKTYKMYELNS